MSAITGMIDINYNPLPLEMSSYLMDPLRKLPHDNMHTWSKTNVFLGCLAQWITPESIGERLPLYDEERKLAITADAIIDNREELFERLQVCKSKREAISDSELILLSYCKWEKESPKYLIGDFAFVIWDEGKNEFFGARDFCGSRTLYYCFQKGIFAFSTIMSPLNSLPFVSKQIDENWLSDFLAIPSMIESTDPSLTVFQNIKQIPPSHSFIVSRKGLFFTKYYTLTEDYESLNLKSGNDYEEAFRDLFKRAVKDRLRTYRNVGSQLSGGLDSSSVVAFAARELKTVNKPLHTYSYIPENDFVDWTPKYRIADERCFIKPTVNYVGNINDNYLDFAGESSYSVIDDWLDIMEMPYKFFENSFWIKGIFEKAKSDGIGILLNGARGNYTISWGSSLAYQAMLLKKLKLFRFYSELYSYSKMKQVSKKNVSKVVLRKAFPTLNTIIQTKKQYEFPQIINPDFASHTNVFQRINQLGLGETSGIFEDAYSIRKKHFEQLFIWNSTTTSGTKLSLRHSLNGRDPTNDIRIIRFCLATPIEQYVQNGIDRLLIRNSTKGMLPDKVRLNQRTRGIQAADVIHRMASHWNEFLGEIKILCNDSKIKNYLDVEIIKNSFSTVKDPISENAFHPNFRMLMRCIILYRFLNRLI
ncbi:asparagine synthase (glutamine-hydrolyzing) [Bacillus tianshenii]|uniref:asparagine synthase (glutamine-hydrolyzing) n=1 Tax=Sutcliffiella tianshenii TaxID=1463404 RepID=A0ABS2NVJ5_9BACI|nr:asparagine synthase-related protein [Bacillus tianshenii]MBM7618260.1 asparagine synthase (glutamine-hydrolyzing) [Bacillus tianshenii]